MAQESFKPRGVFDDFSFASIAASALTAATSFLLMSRIGLAGSFIGAVVAAALSTTLTQTYKGMLTASADRIKEASEPYAAVGRPVPAATCEGYGDAPSDGGRIKHRLVAFAAGISLAAVIASAALIILATRGQGLGPTSWEGPAPIETNEEQVEAPAVETTATANGAETGKDSQAPAATTATAAPADATAVTTEAPEASETVAAPVETIQEELPAGETQAQAQAQAAEPTASEASPQVDAVQQEGGAATEG